MKGILLAGGLGTRMLPLTATENKHFLPVYHKRMIEYPIATLVDAGIRDVILVTGGKNPGAFLELLKNGKSHGLNRLYYTYQEGNGGIADALKLAEPFIEEDEDCVVILGDNYFEDGISDCMEQWEAAKKTWWKTERGLPAGAFVILKQVDDPERFGIAEINEDRIVSIEEKPRHPRSKNAILGCYMLDSAFWPWLDQLTPSKRGELEIIDILHRYMNMGALSYAFYTGYWSDLGTFESWMEVSNRVMGVK